MAKSARSHGEGLDINLTPMIDCTFQLIIFFILTSQFASAALAQLQLHKPVESQVETQTEQTRPDRVIVNVLSKGSGDPNYRDPQWSGEGKRKPYEISGDAIAFDDRATLVKIFKSRRAEAVEAGVPRQEFSVEIRADKDVFFMVVEPVMLAAAEAQIAKVKLTALRQ